MQPINVIAEIGLNYAFGDDRSSFMRNAKHLITIAAAAGCNYVKFQKRNPDLCVPDAQKDKPKRVPWREEETIYLQYKLDVEFTLGQYFELTKYARDHGVELFASVWDEDSLREMAEVTNIVKIPSALLTDDDLLEEATQLFDVRILSTGMSTQEEIDRAVEIYDPTVIMHTNSVYPTPVEHLNLNYLIYLKERFTHDGFPDLGYSSHYYGITDAVAAMGLGISWLEKHITLNHTLWGSDQAASVEPHGLFEMMKKIRDMERAFEGYGPRTVYAGEEEKRKTLRGV